MDPVIPQAPPIASAAIVPKRTATAPWNAWVEGLEGAEERDLAQPAEDGRVTLAEYLDRFAPYVAQYIPYEELPQWMFAIHDAAEAAQRAFHMPASMSPRGTARFHPHTLAWVIDTNLTSVAGMGELPTGEPNPWHTSLKDSPIVPTTAELREAVGDPTYMWRPLNRATVA